MVEVNWKRGFDIANSPMLRHYNVVCKHIVRWIFLVLFRMNTIHSTHNIKYLVHKLAWAPGLSNVPRKSFLCYPFILEQPQATAAVWLESFFFYLNIVWAYCCHSKRAETKGCLFTVASWSFYSTCPQWANLICPVTTQLVRIFFFFEDQLTHPHASSAIFVPLICLLLYIPRLFSDAFLDCVLYLQVFASRVRLHFLALMPCQFLFLFLVGPTHPDTLSLLNRKKEMAFRMQLTGFVFCFFFTVWRTANDYWFNIIKTGNLSPCDHFHQRAISRMVKWVHTSFMVYNCLDSRSQ